MLAIIFALGGNRGVASTYERSELVTRDRDLHKGIKIRPTSKKYLPAIIFALGGNRKTERDGASRVRKRGMKLSQGRTERRRRRRGRGFASKQKPVTAQISNNKRFVTDEPVAFSACV
ncbi:MAG: hypothetical protein LiPW30_149 [Parcubacteria group bacterium LiPW_30]|nr:MAG: hypothetical protein LiPW30_149 [Parcubacteria group bacterium LiPW_30]